MGDGQVTLEWADPSDSTITGYSYSYATSLSAFNSASPPAWHVIPVTREPGPRDVTIGTTGSLDTLGALEDSEGGVVTSNDDGGSGNNFRIQRGLSAGTYYVRVGSFGSATGAYTLGLTAEGVGNDTETQPTHTEPTSSAKTHRSRLTAEDDDHGDARSSATGVALPSETAGRIDPGSDVDYFRFEVSEIIAVTTTSHTVTGLANGTRYYFRLRATNADGDGAAAQTTIQMAATPAATVAISDAALREAVEDALGKGAGAAITQLEMAAVHEISTSDVAQVSGLEHAVNLRSLSLLRGTISDVTALGALTSLTDLNLSSNSLSDITALGALTSLHTLYLDNNSIADVTALGALTSLERLRLGRNSLSDITALGALTSLQHLYLYNNSIADVTALGALTSLTDLNLSSNSLSDITALGALTSLRYLWLMQNSISDVTALGALTSLFTLYLDYNSISDVTALGTLTSLGVLSLSYNSISDVTALGGFSCLQWLVLRDNSISDVAPLAALADAQIGSSYYCRLRELFLDNNLISDVTALRALRFLRRLGLAYNSISDVTALGALTSLTDINLQNNSISELTGLGDLTSLTWLYLQDNSISNVADLGALTSLTTLALHNNSIADVTPLGALTSLHTLYLDNNSIADIAPLRALTSLTTLALGNNSIADVAALETLTSLSSLHLHNNSIADVSALGTLTSLTRLRLDDNRIENVEGVGLDEGDVVGLRGNRLSAAAFETHVPALRQRGVAVLAGRSVPVFPSAADAFGRIGFVRVLNRSDEAGEVLIWAVDDAGERSGPVRLAIAAGAAAHFNSHDLETGSVAKGLPEGVGAPTVTGDWRLELLSTLDINALAYVRTADGFLTAMHNTLPRINNWRHLFASFFNPARNRAQRSTLRLLNPGGVEETVYVGGEDDRGGWQRIWPGLSVSIGSALTVDAAELELRAGGYYGFGRGVGKWRLHIQVPWPVEAMSLLESPSGHLANLSSAPRADADGTWRVPLFPAADDTIGRQGFLRVANRNGRAGEAHVWAMDDGGHRAGPVVLALDGSATVHLNSGDLERGNAAKGLPVGVGAPTLGDWRLALASDLKIEVASYIRHADGFVTSMHELAPWNEADSAARVVFFNPASNRNQRSLLRLINDGGEAANVVITGVDDAAQPGGEARVTVPAGEAVTLSAVELENGTERLEGALGDGSGKWRLTVTADRPIGVMSLMESPTGHLSNLSSAGDGDAVVNERQPNEESGNE